MPGKKPLTDAVAVVAGATRGAGRAIAVALGEQGATVYCTGRSTRGSPSPMNRPETIDETAELVTAAGGRGIAIRVDHTEEEQIAALFDRVKKEAGRLDVLVNDVWGGEKTVEWGKAFWETNLDQGFALIRQAVFLHLITAKHGAPLMIERRRGLMQRSGTVLSSWQLMREYGVEDADGRRPDWGAFFRDNYPAGGNFKVAMRRSVEWQQQMIETAASYLKPRRRTGARKARP